MNISINASSADLERMEKDPQARVSIDDPRAVFLFRWYVEVDKRGKDLSWYQNKACDGYRLPIDNNGEAWRWISNYQAALSLWHICNVCTHTYTSPTYPHLMCESDNRC